jgi:membrane associated rhomboid family serine protease
MGYQERDYYRDDSGESGFQIKSWTVRLLIVTCVVFLANLLTSTTGHQNWLIDLLKLEGNAVANPVLWYQFLTAGFVHNPESLWHLAGNMLGLYVFGTLVEERYGGKELLRIYLIAIVLGAVVWSLRQYFLVGQYRGLDGDLHWFSAMGASGGVTTLITLACLLYPHRTVLLFFAIRTPLWLFGILVILSDLTGAWAAKNIPGDFAWKSIAFDVHLTGAALALAYWGLGLNFGRAPGSRELSTGWNRLKALWRVRPSVRIHEELDADDDDLEAQADRLLAKIARQGESSLTPQERRVLENYSRRIRDKQQ